MKKIFKLRGGRELIIGEKTLVTGILNVTPDSIYGAFHLTERRHAQ